jgi:hypothetical protein
MAKSASKGVSSPVAVKVDPRKAKKEELPWRWLGVLSVLVAILAVVLYSRPPSAYKNAPSAETEAQKSVKPKARDLTPSEVEVVRRAEEAAKGATVFTPHFQR